MPRQRQVLLHRRRRRRRGGRLEPRQAWSLVCCDQCGFVSRRRPVVARHRRFCPTADAAAAPRRRRFTCERCPWTGDEATIYVQHRRAVHGDHISVFKYVQFSFVRYRARQLYKNISMLFLFPVKDGKLSTGVIAIFNASCYGQSSTI